MLRKKCTWMSIRKRYFSCLFSIFNFSVIQIIHKMYLYTFYRLTNASIHRWILLTSEWVCIILYFDEINSTGYTTRNRNLVYVYVQWLKRLIASESVRCGCVCTKIVFFSRYWRLDDYSIHTSHTKVLRIVNKNKCVCK